MYGGVIFAYDHELFGLVSYSDPYLLWLVREPEFRGDMHDELEKVSPAWFVDCDLSYLFHLFQENLPCQDAIEATGFVVPILIRWV